MTKRRLIHWSLLLAILAAFAVWLEPTRVAWGWLRGEAFYQGRPTSWWRGELSRWTMYEREVPFDRFRMRRLQAERTFSRSSTAFENLFASIRDHLYEPSDEEFHARVAKSWNEIQSGPSILHGDPTASSVLAELKDDDTIRPLAELGLNQILQNQQKTGGDAMRYHALLLSAVVAIAGQFAQAQESEAENLFRAMQRKITSAKALQLVVKMKGKTPEFDENTAIQLAIWVKGTDQVRCELRMSTKDKQDVPVLTVCNGTAMAMRANGKTETLPLPAQPGAGVKDSLVTPSADMVMGVLMSEPVAQKPLVN